MPAAHPPEFRQRVVELALERAKPIAQIARDLGISESCLRRWMSQADVDAGRREGVSSEERRELVRLRRENRTLAMENEILKRAAVAYFAKENVLPDNPKVVGSRSARGVASPRSTSASLTPRGRRTSRVRGAR